jgi:hypothetical protein
MKFSKLVGTLAGVLLFTGILWAETHTMQATTVDPSAKGTVEVKPDKNNANAKVTVKVEHLANPSLLAPKAEEYVVWVQPEGQAPQNEGMIRVDKDEKGDLDFTTTASKFTILVTAENDAHPKEPSYRVVLKADVQS